jgi:hypothetical protein
LLDLLQESHRPLTLKEIIAHLNNSLGTWPKEAAQDLAYGLAGHLSWLLSRNLIEESRTVEGWANYQVIRTG